jgi:hypothetical protein
VGSQSLRPLPQLSIRRDEGDPSIGCIRDGFDERIVAAAASMENRQSFVRAGLDALSSLAFKNHDDGLLDPSRVHGRAYVVDERPGRSRSVPPPTGRARPHHIGRINEKHCSSLNDPVQ